jgi:ceramide glucosyltransferase
MAAANWVMWSSCLLLSWLLVQWGALATAWRRAMQRAAHRPLPACDWGRGGRDPHRSQVPAIRVIRPCAGDEPFLERTLLSTQTLSYDGALQCVFAVGRDTDPAWHVATRVAGQLRAQGVDARTVVTHAEGPNHKADQLARVIHMHAEGEGSNGALVVIGIDSDVELTPLALEPLVSALLDDATLGALWVPFVEGVPPRTAGDHVSQAVLNHSMHATSVLAGIDPKGMTGKFVALHATRLQEVGGFEALTAVLGEDMELARRFRQHGYRVEACGWVTRSLASGRSMGDVVRRLSRWVWVIRAQRPALLWGYPFMLAAFPLQLLFAMGIATCSPRTGGWLLALTVGLRLMLSVVAHRMSGRTRVESRTRWMAAALVADVVLLVAWAHALLSRTIEWRGRTLVIHGGVLRDAS